MQHYNVYRIGSCRTNYVEQKKQHENSFVTNSLKTGFTHTTKEAIQHVKFLNNELDIEKCDFPLCFRNLIDNKDDCVEKFKKADVILIEISSIKLCSDTKGIYYNTVNIPKYSSSKTEYKLSRMLMTVDEVKSDIQFLKKQINKPIIFQGHINLNCNIIPNRQIIDDALKTEKRIINFNSLTDKYELICALKENNEIDFNHLNEYGYDLLYNKFMEIVKSIFT